MGGFESLFRARVYVDDKFANTFDLSQDESIAINVVNYSMTSVLFPFIAFIEIA